jgi:hypothetical protein
LSNVRTIELTPKRAIGVLYATIRLNEPISTVLFRQ